jgi:hypothetical protein
VRRCQRHPVGEPQDRIGPAQCLTQRRPMPPPAITFMAVAVAST